MFRFLHRNDYDQNSLLSSRLYNQDTFYKAFLHDLYSARRQIIIESPFITSKRMAYLLPVFSRLSKRGVQVMINTRDPQDHDAIYGQQAAEAVSKLQDIGVTVLYTAGHHRKLAIIDESILWEGSLNILSYNDSCEVMRRIVSTQLAKQMSDFISLEKFL